MTSYTDLTPRQRLVESAERLFAIGPLTRGTFFEIEAIPDIRVQAAELAERLLRHADRVLERRFH